MFKRFHVQRTVNHFLWHNAEVLQKRFVGDMTENRLMPNHKKI